MSHRFGSVFSSADSVRIFDNQRMQEIFTAYFAVFYAQGSLQITNDNPPMGDITSQVDCFNSCAFAR